MFLFLAPKDLLESKTLDPFPLLPLYFDLKSESVRCRIGWKLFISKSLLYLYIARGLLITIRTLPVFYESFSNTVLSIIYVVGLLVSSKFHSIVVQNSREIAFLLTDFHHFTKGVLRCNPQANLAIKKTIELLSLSLIIQIPFVVLFSILGWTLSDDIRFTNSFLLKYLGITSWYLTIPVTLYDTFISTLACQVSMLVTLILILFYYSGSQILQTLRNSDANIESIQTYKSFQIFQNHFIVFFGSSITYSRYGSVALVIAGNAVLVGHNTPIAMRGIGIVTLITGCTLFGYLFPLFSTVNTKSTSLLIFWKNYAKTLAMRHKIDLQVTRIIQKSIRCLHSIDVNAGNFSSFRQHGMLRQISNVFFNSFRLIISRKK